MTDGRRRYTEMPRSRARIHADLDEELGFDLEMRVQELIAQGLGERDARARAKTEFGDMERTRGYCAALDERSELAGRWSRWFSEWRQDVTVAMRAMRASPGFAAVVLLTLAVGLGANIAIYSVVRRMLVDRLPYRDAGSLVRVAYPGSGTSAYNGFVSAIQLRDLATAPSLDGVAAFGNLGSITYYGEQAAEPVPMASVTPNFFAVLGAPPLLGRSFGDADVAADASPAVIVSYDFWQQELRGDSAVIGRPIRLSGGNRTVVGIMPRSFVSPQFTAGMWLVLNTRSMLAAPRTANAAAYRAIARLRRGATIERATEDAATLATRWRADAAVPKTALAPRFVPLRDAMVGEVRPALLAVMSAAVLVLLITCTNIAGLFLTRATGRRREMALRAALGAGRGRLVRQLLTETLMYGAGGGVLGVALAELLHPTMVRVAASALPALGEIRIDFALIAPALGVALICGVVVGLMPALAATRVDLRQSIGGERMRLRQALVGSQVALAVLLMIGAGLLVRSFERIVNMPRGYSTGGDVLVFNVVAPDGAAPNQDARNAFFGDIAQRIHALPGVVNVATTWIGPWNGPNGTTIKSVVPGGGGSRVIDAEFLTASEEYFAAMGTKLLRGRTFATSDRFSGAAPAILSERAARQLFGNVDPIGQRVIVDTTAVVPDPGHEVIGIAQDFADNEVSEGGPAIYVLDGRENKQQWAQFIVRTRGDASRIIPAVRGVVHDAIPEVPVLFPQTMRDVLRRFVAPQQLSLSLFGAFAVVALTLAALGVYGVMSYVVATRTREFGIRAALGARTNTILTLVLRQGMRAAVVGATAGLALALFASQLMSKLLVGVSPRDPMTFVVAPVLLLTIALLACAIPARRATRVDPMEALRAE